MGARSGRGRRAWPGGRRSRGCCLSESRGCGGGGGGGGEVVRSCGRRLGSGGGSDCGRSGPSGAAAVRTPAAAGEAQPGLRAPRSRRVPGTGDPSGNPELSRVDGPEPALQAQLQPPCPGRWRTAPGSGPGLGHPSAHRGREDPCPGRLRSVCSRCPAPLSGGAKLWTCPGSRARALSRPGWVGTLSERR